MDPKHLTKLTVPEWIDFGFKDEKKHTARCDIGTKASTLLSVLDALRSKNFYNTAKKFYLVCLKYMYAILPLDEQIFLDGQYLNPTRQTKKNAVNGIGRLAGQIYDVLGSTALLNVFKFKGPKDQLIDQIRNECIEYQTGKYPTTLLH